MQFPNSRAVFRLSIPTLVVSLFFSAPIFADLIVDQHIDELVSLASNGDKEKFVSYVKQQDLLSTADKDGHSPLFAAMFGPPELTGAMLELGAPLEHQDKLGFTPLISASLLGYPQAVDKLLQKGAQIEARNFDGQTALLISVLSLAVNQGDTSAVADNRWHNNWQDVITLLLEQGADVNTVDKRGVSPLFVAIFAQDYQLCRSLIKAGANINHKLPNGVSMLRFAKIGSSPAIVDLLVANGAEI
ncbi:ankyrin repeat domain-containing protein [Kaarinaea lacus]